MYLDEKEIDLSKEFLKNGYLVKDVADRSALDWIQKCLRKAILNETGTPGLKTAELLNNIHKYIPDESLNKFRLKLINELNSLQDFRHMYFKIAKPYLEALVGNELAMQMRVNMSIQIPHDESSLLPIHADTWSGDSPFEIVVWIPMVDCFKTKSMFLLNPSESKVLNSIDFNSIKTSEELYSRFESKFNFINIKYGQVLLFYQGLPHGNRINKEAETRWSFNCRFKSIFTPYGDKKIGEFFEPITMRALTELGLNYKFPDLL